MKNVAVNLQSVCVSMPDEIAKHAIETGDFGEIRMAVLGAVARAFKRGDGIESVEELD